MFVDTSVIVAILAGEDDATQWSDRLEQTSGKVTSALVVLEATMRLSTLLAIEPSTVGATIEAFLREAEIEIVPIGNDEARLAIEAFSNYGKGRGHAAQLNLADCLSYACAKGRGLPLLYKGNDFSHTDLA
ncbi:type II toxin-antitoxin system VapC family toxin [Mesorhizobium sp. KR1-2]|uniref:type II toxin-antitoxin system VapC family toxin n=1 Tax=Mesorhizobium sp. KR1-2 TaxID=3156609 RepID=UPI0032B58061